MNSTGKSLRSPKQTDHSPFARAVVVSDFNNAGGFPFPRASDLTIVETSEESDATSTANDTVVKERCFASPTPSKGGKTTELRSTTVRKIVQTPFSPIRISNVAEESKQTAFTSYHS